MSTLIGVLDRNWWGARTDNIVLVDAESKTLTWIPRDVYIPSIKNRINAAYGLTGSHDKFREAAAEIGFRADYSIVILPSATMQLLSTVSVTVPVDYPMKFRYPLRPVSDIHLGEKEIEFNPPSELLEGERVHQWLGARLWIGPPRPPTQDMHRIIRQQVFIKRLLEEKFDFSQLPAEGVNVSDPKAYDDLKLVESTWKFVIHGNLTLKFIDGMAVLVEDIRQVVLPPMVPTKRAAPQIDQADRIKQSKRIQQIQRSLFNQRRIK